MDILILYQGLYGQRIADNLKPQAPKKWQVKMLKLPKVLPVIVDEPEGISPLLIWCCIWPRPRKQPSFCRGRSG